jgi:hypothetical protein
MAPSVLPKRTASSATLWLEPPALKRKPLASRWQLPRTAQTVWSSAKVPDRGAAAMLEIQNKTVF